MLECLLCRALMLLDPLLQNTPDALNHIESRRRRRVCIVMQASFLLISPCRIVKAASPGPKISSPSAVILPLSWFFPARPSILSLLASSFIILTQSQSQLYDPTQPTGSSIQTPPRSTQPAGLGWAMFCFPDGHTTPICTMIIEILSGPVRKFGMLSACQVAAELCLQH